MSSSKASAKNQEEYDNQRLSKIEYINNQFEEIKKKEWQQLQDQYEELKSSEFPPPTSEDDRIDKWWLLVNTGHITEAETHYGKDAILESRSARIQSTISKHPASSAPRPSASSSPSPYHNRRSTRPSARPSARPSRINEENYQNIKNWQAITNKNGENIYRFDPENGYTENVSVEKYKKIMGILPPNPNTGGSRKRSRRHSKKQKRVRHTRRKQTRRHRHSRHRR